MNIDLFRLYIIFCSCTYISAISVYHLFIIKSRVLFLFGCKKYLEVLKTNPEIEKRIGNNIRAIRESRGMTQEILASKLQLSGCDITRSAVAKIEVGQRHLYPDEIILIKEILKTTYEEIFEV